MEYESLLPELSLHFVPKLTGQYLDSLQKHKMSLPQKYMGQTRFFLYLLLQCRAETENRKEIRTLTKKELRTDC